MAILATGPRYQFHGGLGTGRPSDFLKPAQIEAAVHGIQETEIFLGSRVAPDSFAGSFRFKRSVRAWPGSGSLEKSQRFPICSGC